MSFSPGQQKEHGEPSATLDQTAKRPTDRPAAPLYKHGAMTPSEEDHVTIPLSESETAARLKQAEASDKARLLTPGSDDEGENDVCSEASSEESCQITQPYEIEEVESDSSPSARHVVVTDGTNSTAPYFANVVSLPGDQRANRWLVSTRAKRTYDSQSNRPSSSDEGGRPLENNEVLCATSPHLKRRTEKDNDQAEPNKNPDEGIASFVGTESSIRVECHDVQARDSVKQDRTTATTIDAMIEKAESEEFAAGTMGDPATVKTSDASIPSADALSDMKSSETVAQDVFDAARSVADSAQMGAQDLLLATQTQDPKMFRKPSSPKVSAADSDTRAVGCEIIIDGTGIRFVDNNLALGGSVDKPAVNFESKSKKHDYHMPEIFSDLPDSDDVSELRAFPTPLSEGKKARKSQEIYDLPEAAKQEVMEILTSCDSPFEAESGPMPTNDQEPIKSSSTTASQVLSPVGRKPSPEEAGSVPMPGDRLHVEYRSAQPTTNAPAEKKPPATSTPRVALDVRNTMPAKFSQSTNTNEVSSDREQSLFVPSSRGVSEPDVIKQLADYSETESDFTGAPIDPTDVEETDDPSESEPSDDETEESLDWSAPASYHSDSAAEIVPPKNDRPSVRFNSSPVDQPVQFTYTGPVSVLIGQAKNFSKQVKKSSKAEGLIKTEVEVFKQERDSAKDPTLVLPQKHEHSQRTTSMRGKKLGHMSKNVSPRSFEEAKITSARSGEDSSARSSEGDAVQTKKALRRDTWERVGGREPQHTRVYEVNQKQKRLARDPIINLNSGIQGSLWNGTRPPRQSIVGEHHRRERLKWMYDYAGHQWVRHMGAHSTAESSANDEDSSNTSDSDSSYNASSRHKGRRHSIKPNQEKSNFRGPNDASTASTWQFLGQPISSARFTGRADGSRAVRTTPSYLESMPHRSSEDLDRLKMRNKGVEGTKTAASAHLHDGSSPAKASVQVEHPLGAATLLEAEYVGLIEENRHLKEALASVYSRGASKSSDGLGGQPVSENLVGENQKPILANTSLKELATASQSKDGAQPGMIEKYPRCTYREALVLLLSDTTIASKLFLVAGMFPTALEAEFAEALRAIFERYLNRLLASAASTMEITVHDVLSSLLIERSQDQLRPLVRLLQTLKTSYKVPARNKDKQISNLVAQVDALPDNDFYARRLDRPWLKWFEAPQIQWFLFQGGPALYLREALASLAVPKRLDVPLLVEMASRMKNESAYMELPRIATELAMAHPSTIRFGSGRPPAWFVETWKNKIQLAVEGSTKAQWDWWPLANPQRPVLGGNELITWACSCGQQRSTIVPQQFAHAVLRSLYRYETLTDNSTLHLQNHQSPATLGKREVAQSSSNSNFIAGRNAMELTDLERGSLTPLAPSSSKDKASPHPHSRSVSSLGSSTIVGSQDDSDDLLQRYVFFTIKNGHEYLLSQIAVWNVGDDGFFSALKREYLKGKGRWRRWFSVWKFAHCDFTMFEKIAENEITHRPEGSSLPPDSKKEYTFTPRPPELLPPISKHEFRRRFYRARKSPSSSSADSKSCCMTKHALQRIPKRDIDVTELGDERDFFWGLLAIDEISFVRVCCYVLLLLVPPSVWWVYWMATGHATDLQNASVPFLCIIAIVSLVRLPTFYRS